jgi:hypothetical protein
MSAVYLQAFVREAALLVMLLLIAFMLLYVQLATAISSDEKLYKAVVLPSPSRTIVMSSGVGSSGSNATSCSVLSMDEFEDETLLFQQQVKQTASGSAVSSVHHHHELHHALGNSTSLCTALVHCADLFTAVADNPALASALSESRSLAKAVRKRRKLGEALAKVPELAEAVVQSKKWV